MINKDTRKKIDSCTNSVCSNQIILTSRFLQARAITVPTDDASVKARLRELEEPISESFATYVQC